MPHSIGVTITEKITSGLIKDLKVSGSLRSWPDGDGEDDADALIGMPADQIASLVCDEIVALSKQSDGVTAIGLGLPGIVRNGIIEDSPNLPQMKGMRIREIVSDRLKQAGLDVPVGAHNDADAMATGIAATKGYLERVIRVWTLGNGIGYGRYPMSDGIWEGGHYVVTMDSKETYCGCGGRGHLEGICGYRAMRLRFLDMEPEEVFAAARPTGTKQGDARCVDFVKMWHRALAAATANSVHMQGPGRFYYTGFLVKFLDVNTLNDYLHQMVKMSPLQSYSVEIIAENSEISVIGSAVAAERSGGRMMPG